MHIAFVWQDWLIFKTMRKSKELSQDLWREIVDFHERGRSLWAISKQLPSYLYARWAPANFWSHKSKVVFRNTISDLTCAHVPTYKRKGEQQGNGVGCKAGIICFRTGVKCSRQPSFQHARWHAKLMLQECVWTAHSIQGSHLTEQPTSVNSPRVPFQFPVLCFCISVL